MLDSNFLLTDEQMIQFITRGYLVLRNHLPEQQHKGVLNKIRDVMSQEGNPGNNVLPRIPDIQQFFDTPVVQGALTSVLGPDYYMHPHRHCHYNKPVGQNAGVGQAGHKDGYWSAMRSHRPWWAMIFYYTQDITEDMGPTAILPGSQYYEKLPGEKANFLLPTGKAGTMVLVHFDLWHKASVNVSELDRYMLKFQFSRLRAPEYPSWNHSSQQFRVPDGGEIVPHLNLWQDVWDWLRGDPSSREDRPAANAERFLELETALSSADEETRAAAADELGLYGEAAAPYAQALGQLLSDPSEQVVLNAAYALGNLGPAGIGVLVRHMAEGSQGVAEPAAYGLQAAGRAAVPELMNLMKHPDAWRRALAAFVLGMLGPIAGEAVPALLASVGDDSEWVARNAIEALGMNGTGEERSIPILAQSLADSLISEGGEGSKANSEPQAAMQKYIKNKIGYTAALALMRTGGEAAPEKAIPALEQALQSNDRYVRAYASEALSSIRTDAAVDVLIRHIRTSRWCADTTKASTY